MERGFFEVSRQAFFVTGRQAAHLIPFNTITTGLFFVFVGHYYGYWEFNLENGISPPF
jgi:hypothetical protein